MSSAFEEQGTAVIERPIASVTAFRRPPHNVEAEIALLGAIFVNNRAYERVSDFLRPESFSVAEHQRIYAATAKLIERGQVADPITLKAHFEQTDNLAEIGGPAYLMKLAQAAVTVINAGEYGRLIYDLHLRRELIALGEDVVNRAYDSTLDEPAPAQIEMAEQCLYDLASSGTYEGGFEAFGATLVNAINIAEAAHKRQGQLSGVTTGLMDLDGKLGGLHDSDLIILAGRPSMGKSALATNIAFNAAKAYRTEADDTGRVRVADGAAIGIFSLEMSREQLATRILAEQTRISSDYIRRGMVKEDRFSDLVLASQELSSLPIFIDDTPALSMSAIRTRCRRLKRQHGLGLIVIDYLQLIAPSPGSRHDSRVQELSEITRSLKALAKELNIPVLALSQLSRAVEQREDKRPQLADLRESGTIEQDSDVVMFIFREEYYLSRAEPVQRGDEDLTKFCERHDKWKNRCEEAYNKAEIIVAKHRHGPIGAVNLFFEGEFTRFADLETREFPDA